MGPKAFKFALASIGAFLALSALPGTGLFIALFFAFSIAFFIGPLAFGLQKAIETYGLSIEFTKSVSFMLLAYYTMVAIGFLQALRNFAAGNLGRARRICAKAAFFAAIPLAGYFSSDILVRAWP